MNHISYISNIINDIDLTTHIWNPTLTMDSFWLLYDITIVGTAKFSMRLTQARIQVHPIGGTWPHMLYYFYIDLLSNFTFLPLKISFAPTKYY